MFLTEYDKSGAKCFILNESRMLTASSVMVISTEQEPDGQKRSHVVALTPCS